MYNVSKKLLTIFLIPILMTFGFKAHGQEVEEIIDHEPKMVKKLKKLLLQGKLSRKARWQLLRLSVKL